MHKASARNAWITVMGGINSIAVAVMDDLSCILLAEDSSLDQEAKERADKDVYKRQVKSKGINTIFTGPCPVKKDGPCRPFLFMEPRPAQAL